MNILNLVIDKALILVPTLYIIGEFLKRTPFMKNWYIPWVLLGAGILGAVGLLGFSGEAVIQGVLTTGAAVLGNQLLKQTSSRGQEKE